MEATKERIEFNCLALFQGNIFMLIKKKNLQFENLMKTFEGIGEVLMMSKVDLLSATECLKHLFNKGRIWDKMGPHLAGVGNGQVLHSCMCDRTPTVCSIMTCLENPLKWIQAVVLVHMQTGTFVK